MNRLTIIVTGGRDYANRERVFKELDTYLGRSTLIVHGDCPTGADKHADDWAVSRNSPVNCYPADWKRWGAAAGPIRNDTIIRFHGSADLCLAFPGGSGTADMVARCKRHGIPVKEVE